MAILLWRGIRQKDTRKLHPPGLWHKNAFKPMPAQDFEGHELSFWDSTLISEVEAIRKIEADSATPKTAVAILCAFDQDEIEPELAKFGGKIERDPDDQAHVIFVFKKALTSEQLKQVALFLQDRVTAWLDLSV